MGNEFTKHFSFQGRPKFAQIGIFGLKIYHLANPVQNHFLGLPRNFSHFSNFSRGKNVIED
jgi:hypothetical protein